MSDAAASSTPPPPPLASYTIKWNKKEFEIALAPLSTVGDLKDEIFLVTGVLARRQKLLTLKGAGDSEVIANVKLKAGAPLLLMGTPEDALEELASSAVALQAEQEKIVDDLVDEPEVELAAHENAVFQAKLANRIRNYELELREQPRPGKKLLVLDIDYTVYDHRSTAETMALLTRPHLLDTLARAYEHFEIVFWSATGMSWIQLKLAEMGCFSDARFKILALVDFSAMVTLQTAKYGVYNAKPLAVLWAKLPQFSAQNTIMFDDLGRNFAFNPKNGIKIKPFKHGPTNRDDGVLLQMQRYLDAIKEAEDVSALDNNKLWRLLA